MRSKTEKQLAIKWKNDGYSYKKIADLLSISRQSAVNLCNYRLKIDKITPGTKPKLTSKDILQIKRCVGNMKDRQERVNSTKILFDTGIKCSTRTIQRYMKKNGYMYKRILNKIILNDRQKQRRIEVVSEWIRDSQNCNKTIFSDEKCFSLDGPSDWRTYQQAGNENIHQKRQNQGGKLMVWLMALPNGLLSFRFINGKFNSQYYVNLMKEMVIPIMKLNFKNEFWFQEDNCSVHKSKYSTAFMKDSGISKISWPANSPDLNLVEDIWKLISDRVYDGPQCRTKEDLKKKIVKEINFINYFHRTKIIHLFKGMHNRLIKVIQKKGGLIN